RPAVILDGRDRIGLPEEKVPKPVLVAVSVAAVGDAVEPPLRYLVKCGAGVTTEECMADVPVEAIDHRGGQQEFTGGRAVTVEHMLAQIVVYLFPAGGQFVQALRQRDTGIVAGLVQYPRGQMHGDRPSLGVLGQQGRLLIRDW